MTLAAFIYLNSILMTHYFDLLEIAKLKIKVMTVIIIKLIPNNM